LLYDPWLPVRCRTLRRRWITVAQLSDPDVLAFDADRADFNGALAQFAIAVLQTVAAVDIKSAWQQRYRQPPDEATLAGWLKPLEDRFLLDGDGPRFMQDFDLRAGDSDPVPIASLLIETPGENTLKNNGDHFIKRHQVRHLCPDCAAQALFTLQINAPAGGAGNRTSVRGGGPLTTLLLAPADAHGPRSLWQTLWLNVMLSEQFNALNGELDHDQPHHQMPWLRPISDIQAAGGTTAPSQVHPLHVYWAMPRRIRLDWDQVSSGACDICRRPSDRLISQYAARPQGLNYKGAWRHPLSPYYTVKDEQLPMHPQPGGLGYRHWLGLVLGMHSDKRQVQAAGALRALMEDQLLNRSGIAPQIWAFGYDMDNAKARCWYEATMPVFDLVDSSTEELQQLRDDVTAWIAGVDLVAAYLRGAVKDAWFSGDARGDFSHVDAAFWSHTESAFYLLLRERLMALRDHSADDGLAAKQSWRATLSAAAMRLFDHDFVGTGPVEGQNLARVAKARNQLQASLRGPKLRVALALPEPPKPVAVARKSSSKSKPVPASAA
jgi:CRISPR system Cascade subunit CasA